MAQVQRAVREVRRPIRSRRLRKSKGDVRWHVRTERKPAGEQAAARVDDRARDERAASGRCFNPSFRNQFGQRVLRQAMAPALTGIALGLAAAFVTTRALSSMLFGLSSTDPLTFVLVPLALLLVSLLACLAPG